MLVLETDNTARADQARSRLDRLHSLLVLLIIMVIRKYYSVSTNNLFT